MVGLIGSNGAGISAPITMRMALLLPSAMTGVGSEACTAVLATTLAVLVFHVAHITTSIIFWKSARHRD